MKADLQLLGGVSPHYMAGFNSIYEVKYKQSVLQSVHRCEDGGRDKRARDNVTGEASLGEKNVRVRIKVSSRMKIIRDSTLDVWPLPLIATSSSHCTRP